MVLLDTKSLLTDLISQCLSLQFKASLKAQRVSLGKNNFDGKFKRICSWLQIASEHTLDLNEMQDTILKNEILYVVCSAHSLSITFSLQLKTFAVASLQIS